MKSLMDRIQEIVSNILAYFKAYWTEIIGYNTNSIMVLNVVVRIKRSWSALCENNLVAIDGYSQVINGH